MSVSLTRVLLLALIALALLVAAVAGTRAAAQDRAVSVTAAPALR